MAAVFILTLCLYSSPVWAADPDLPPVGQEEGEDTGEAVNTEVSLTFSDTLEEEKGTEEPGGDTPALDPETADDAAPAEGEDVGGDDSGGDTPAPDPETAYNTTIETGDEESLTDDCASEESDEAMPAFFALQSTDEPYFFNDPEEDLVIVTSIERMGLDITIIAKTITVEPDVIISTQYLVNGVTSGNSGHITFIARVITLKERVQLLTCVTDDLYTAGNITLQAESGVDQYIDDAEARIEINSGSGIKGKDIKITARAHALRPEQEMDEDLDFNDVVVRVLEDLLANPGDALTLFAVQKDALARITIADFVTIIAGSTEGGKVYYHVTGHGEECIVFTHGANMDYGLFKHLVDYFKTITKLSVGMFPVMENQNISASYWLCLRGYKPAEEAKNFTIPMLILQGDNNRILMPGNRIHQPGSI